MRKAAFSLALVFAFLVGNTGFALTIRETAQSSPAQKGEPTLTAFPAAIDPECHEGSAAIFDECSDQKNLFDQAFQRSKVDGKTLLVVYGAEWCIWAHAFDKYVKGVHGEFTHTYSSPEGGEWYTETMYERGDASSEIEARELARYVATNFVIAYIEDQYSEGGWDVMVATGADKQFDEWVPFVFTVDRDGKIARHFDRRGVEMRRDTDDWFRGYNRKGLREQLEDMRKSALNENNPNHDS